MSSGTRPSSESDSTDLALDRALHTVVREAFRTAINLCPLLERRTLTASVSGLDYELRKSIWFNRPDRSKLFPLTVSVDAEELARCADSRDELFALGGRLGRSVVYDMGLADGV